MRRKPIRKPTKRRPAARPDSVRFEGGALRWNINLAAREFGVSWATIRKGLLEAGVKVEKGGAQTFSTRQILAAVAGDLKTERTRLTRAQREAQEIENRVRASELVELEDVRARVAGFSSLIGQRLKGIPGDLAHLTNPTDPVFARAALQRWVDEMIPQLRVDLK